MIERESERLRAFISGPIQPAPGALPDRGDRVRLSVVVPSYNQARYLERTILSIINQHYPNTELIVMDGGSSDGSLEILERYRDAIDVLQVGEDSGQADAINRGFALATGEFVAWQNSDDLYLPGYFDRVNRAVRENPKLDFIVANHYAIDENDTILYATHYGPFIADALLNHDWNMGSQTAFVRRDLARRIGPMPNVPVGFDWYWFIRVGQASRRTAVIKTCGGCYRLHDEAKLSSFDRERRSEIEQEMRRMLGADSTGLRPRLKRAYYQWLKGVNRRILYPRSGQATTLTQVWTKLWTWFGYTLIGFI